MLRFLIYKKLINFNYFDRLLLWIILLLLYFHICVMERLILESVIQNSVLRKITWHFTRRIINVFFYYSCSWFICEIISLTLFAELFILNIMESVFLRFLFLSSFRTDRNLILIFQIRIITYNQLLGHLLLILHIV